MITFTCMCMRVHSCLRTAATISPQWMHLDTSNKGICGYMCIYMNINCHWYNLIAIMYTQSNGIKWCMWAKIHYCMYAVTVMKNSKKCIKGHCTIRIHWATATCELTWKKHLPKNLHRQYRWIRLTTWQKTNSAFAACCSTMLLFKSFFAPEGECDIPDTLQIAMV